ncbi:DEAD/DEAH box helicase [Immundisolibacter sp.]|uniref:DEAD/DEAH box helicase n=1 Tax=Immundisolibacter sp. TaxID=1934948 RepID=UPI002B1335B6|nr:DEAD/DEAH box helicase [Immundisolibacter sp.]MEA3219836.1 ATP-dependent RNA helicase RhlE [Immundisolibacter sp.]
MPFSTLGLRAELCRAVSAQGYDAPTPIQQQAIPVILAGKDVLAAAQTGTGKTAGFSLPMLQRLAASEQPARPKSVRALVLTPTRELAAQVGQNVKDYGSGLRLRSAVIFGGVGINPQTNALARGLDVLVATPGRLLDHLQQGNCVLDRVEILVLDEADRMLDMGFIRDIRRILALLPKQRQTLLFSATFSPEIRALAAQFLHQPVEIDVSPRNSTVSQITQVAYAVDKGRKRELLSWLVGSNNWQQVLVFARTKHGANRLAEQLDSDGLKSAAIHGNKSQGARTRALEGFKNGDVRVLVATDIAARGIDIDQLPLVVNHDLPDVPHDYVHRIGRTGRAGRDGQAISLVAPDEIGLLRSIERLVNQRISPQVLPGYEPSPHAARAEPDARPPQRGRPPQGAGRRPGPSRSAPRGGRG